MRLFWRWSDSMGPARRWIVWNGGERLGWIGVGREGDEVHARVEVDLAGGGADAYAEAFAFAERQAAALGAGEVVTDVWTDRAAALAALRTLGWAQRRHERFWRLELQPAKERLLAERAAAREAAKGLSAVTAAEFGGESVLRTLYEINNQTQADIPRSIAFVPDPFELWAEWMSPPRSTLDRIWVGVADGAAVGFSLLSYRPVGIVETGYTGVLREYRGRGLARLLKLETLVQAANFGVEAVETDNDSENAPIIHLNQALGYSEITGQLEFAKRLG